MSNEIDVVKPTVRISGADVTDMFALRVTKKSGIQASTATLRYSAGVDTTGPTTLINGGSYLHKQRVVIYNNDTSTIWYHGWLTGRQDQHAQNVVLWTCTDDTMLMRDVPIRGCFYMDTLLDGTQELKYSASLPTTFNPNGAWNCTGVDIDGTVYPVFTPTAVYGKAYEVPDNDYSGTPSVTGDPEPWTPRRILQYLQLVMHWDEVIEPLITPNSRPVGMSGNYETAIDTDTLELTFAHIAGLVGFDPSTHTVDPLDRSVQQLTLQGDTLLGGFNKALDVAGTHTIATQYDTAVITAGKTDLIFKPSGYVSSGVGKEIDIQFNDTVDTTYGTVYDFSLKEDSTNTSTAVVCEGEVSKVETRLQYTATSGTDTIVPAWIALEESSFKRCIFGNVDLTGTQGDYALMPKVNGNGSASAGDYYIAKGQAQSGFTPPLVLTNTAEAIALARQSFPTVFRAFTIKTQGTLEDALEQPSDSNGTMIHPRPILPEQLQFFTWLADEVGDTRLRANLPIRLSIDFNGTGEYIDPPKDTAIRVTTDDQGNTMIWLDGSAEGVDGTIECIYDGSLYNLADVKSGGSLAMRNFRLNCAIPTDYRTAGLAADLNPAWQSPDYDLAFAGTLAGPIQYLDRPTSYREHWQYKSFPAANPLFYGGADGTTEEGSLTTGLTREVPPGSEYVNAGYAAERELQRRKEIKRTSTWIQAGIQSGFDSGDWLSLVNIWINGQAVNTYTVEGQVGTVVLDFLKQETRVGDVFNEFGMRG